MSNRKMRYFLGTSSPNGYITRFGELINFSGYHCYILKGGPGFEKSQLMERLVAKRNGAEDIDEFYCSSDDSRLDAVIFHGLKAIVVDGAPPHAFEPNLPIIYQTAIDLSDCWEIDKLMRFKASIVRCYDDYRRLSIRCRRFLSAFSSLCSDTADIAADTLNTPKLEAFVSSIISRTLPRSSSSTAVSYASHEYKEFKQLCAITPDGYRSFTAELSGNYDKIFVITDNYFTASRKILNSIAEIAARRGTKCLISESPIFPSSEPEHLLIPEYGIAFLTSSFINKISIDNAKNINCLRFYDKQQLSRHKQRIQFNKKAGIELLNEAIYSLLNARETHEELEDYYLFALNPQLLEEKYEILSEKLNAHRDNT